MSAAIPAPAQRGPHRAGARRHAAVSRAVRPASSRRVTGSVWEGRALRSSLAREAGDAPYSPSRPARRPAHCRRTGHWPGEQPGNHADAGDPAGDGCSQH
jgi:hypothetical protein